MDANHCGRWWDLSPYWDDLKKLGDERDKQKLHYASTCNWSRYSTHFIGLLGEKVISLITGLPMDLFLRALGDGGRDFKYNSKIYEIRATQYFNDPHLKQKPDARFWVDFYIAIGIDIDGMRGRVAGWATQEDVRRAQFRNYGHGDMLTLTTRNLRKGLPPDLPSAAPVIADPFVDNIFECSLD